MLPTDLIPDQLLAAGAQIRMALPDDAVAGVQPAFVAAPATTLEASAVLRAAAALGLAVVPRGTATKLHWGNPPERCDLIIDTTRMDQVIEHAAGDLVVTVQAGVTLAHLTEVLSPAGQRLALDPPGAGTIGGMLATGSAGPLRLRYGTPRDLLLGVTVALADGTVAHSGGKVVKNVAGYDLGKLYAGSRGTLGLITEATFRLHPIPASTSYLTVDCESAGTACRTLAAALDSPHAPIAAELYWPSGSQTLQVSIALEGDPAALAERAANLAAVLQDTAPAQAIADRAPPPWWGQAPAGGTVLQLAFWPGDLAVALAEARSTAGSTGIDPVIVGSAGSGSLLVAVPATAPAPDVASFVAALRTAIGHHSMNGASPPARASAVVLHAPPDVRELADMFGPVPSLPLMRAVKARFDPARQMSPGRFAGGI